MHDTNHLKKYDCYLEQDEWERLNLSEIMYEVKNYRLIEIWLENWLVVRQWKDIPIMREAEDGTVFHMEYWMLYLTHWQDIIRTRDWWGEDELKEWLDICAESI